MKKFLTTRVALIIVGLLALLFNVVFWAIVGSELGAGKQMGITLWISCAMVMVSFVVAGAITFIRPGAKSATLAMVPMFYATWVYVGVGLVMNMIFMFVNTNKKGAYIADIVLNAILLIVYAIFMVIAYKHFSRVNTIFEKKEERVVRHYNWSSKISSLISLAEHDEVKVALVEFRRIMNYSSSGSNEKTAEADAKLEEELDNLEVLIKSGASVEEQMRAVKFARVALDERNRAVAMAR